MTELRDWGERLLQAPGFEWSKGMRWMSETGSGVIDSRDHIRIVSKYSSRVPDISDPATKGAVLGRIRTLTGCPVCVEFSGSADDLEWYAQDVDYKVMAMNSSEEEVYVQAMEKADGWRI